VKRIGAVLILASTVTWGAVAAPQRQSFEVASIKRSQSTDPRSDLGLQPGGGLRSTNMPLFLLIWIAHGVQAYQVVDVPDWARAERYDITAKPPDGVAVDRDVQFAMIRSLLEDRFGLRVRREQRQMPVYNLVRVRSDGQPGPRLKNVAIDCMARIGSAATPSELVAAGCSSMSAPGRVMSRGYPLSMFIALLGPFVDRVIVDRTGLTGSWDAEVEFTPERPGPNLPSPADTATLLTAMQEQLGLKLEPATGPADVLVIEQVTRPTEN
jgi:uncharacterized protein (TIGR03435 family)